MTNNTRNERMAKSRLNWYLRSEWNSIWQAYEKPSYNKEKAWYDCQILCSDYNGYNLKVIGKNSSFFTAGFLFNDEKGNKKFMFITYANNYECFVN